MKRIEFTDYHEVAQAVEDALENMSEYKDYADVSVVAKYAEAKEVLKELISLGHDIAYIQIEDGEWEGYDDEYIVTLSGEPKGLSVWCEPFKRDGKYFSNCSDVSFVMDNCNSACLSHIDTDACVEVCINENEESSNLDDRTSESMYISRDDNGKATGFSKSWYDNKDGVEMHSSFSHYTNSEKLLKEVAKQFGIEL